RKKPTSQKVVAMVRNLGFQCEKVRGGRFRTGRLYRDVPTDHAILAHSFTIETQNVITDPLQINRELRDELQRLNAYALRGDALAVASVAYRMRHIAEAYGLEVVEKGAARIEESARKNNVAQFLSEINLLDHQVRWFVQSENQPVS
ncbi:MAG: hypothetical protein ACK5PZ_18340, partial [Pirellula sp.]